MTKEIVLLEYKRLKNCLEFFSFYVSCHRIDVGWCKKKLKPEYIVSKWFVLQTKQLNMINVHCAMVWSHCALLQSHSSLS